MQACFWGSPPVSVSSPQQPGPAMQTGYYNVQQNTLDQRIPQQSSNRFFQPHSNPASWTTNQNPVWYTSSNHQGSSSTQVPLRGPSHQATVPAAQFGNNAQNLTHPQFSNSSYQQQVLSMQNATSGATFLASSSKNTILQYQKKYTAHHFHQVRDRNASTIQQNGGQQQPTSPTDILYQCHRNVVNKNFTYTPSIPANQTLSRPPPEYTLPSRQRQPSCEANRTTSHQYFQNDTSQPMTNNQYPAVLPQVTVQTRGLPPPYPQHKRSLPNQVNAQTQGLHSDISKTSTDLPIHKTSTTNSPVSPVVMFRDKLLSLLLKLNPKQVQDITSSREKLRQFIRTQVHLSSLIREIGHQRQASQCVSPVKQTNDEILRGNVEAAKDNASVPKQVQAVSPSTVQLDSNQEQVLGHTTTINKNHFYNLNNSRNLQVGNDNPEKPNMSTINDQSPTPTNEGQKETTSGVQILEPPNSDPEVEAISNATPSLSEVPAYKLTLDNLRHLIRNSGFTCTNEMPTDLLKQLFILYWDGDVRNLVKHVDRLKEVIIQSYELGVKESDAVVLQYWEPSKMKNISQHFHIVNDETTLSPEEFTSSWLNVDKQPADVDGVLAEPMANYVLAENLPQKVSHDSESKNDPNYAENISISDSKSVIESSPQSSSEPFTAGNSCLEHERLGVEIVSTEITDTNVIMTSKDKNANLLICDAESEETLIAVSQEVQADVKINDDGFKQQSMTENNKEELDKLNITSSKQNENIPSNEEDCISEDDSMEITVLSSENARTLFQETMQPNKPNHEQLNLPSNNRFTCPHVIDISSSGLLCSKCWNETPLLEVDLDDVESLEQHDQNQTGLIWIDEPDEDQNSLVCTGIDSQASETQMVDSSRIVPAKSDSPKLFDEAPVQKLHDQLILTSPITKDTNVIARLAEEANVENQPCLIWIDEPDEDQNLLVCTSIDSQASETLVDSSRTVPAKLCDEPPVQKLHDQLNLTSPITKDTNVIARLAEEANVQNQPCLIWIDEPDEDQNSLVCTSIDSQASKTLIDSSRTVPAKSDGPKLFVEPTVQKLHDQLNLTSPLAKDTNVIARLAEEANVLYPQFNFENYVNAKLISQDKPPPIIVSPPKYSSKEGNQLHNTGATPAVDICSPPAIVKKRKYHKQHHTKHECNPTTERKKYRKVQKDNPKERSPIKITIQLDEHCPQSGQDSLRMCKKTSAKRQAPNTGTVLGRNGVRPKPKRPYFKKMGNEGSKQAGQSVGGRKVRFELFGSSRGDVGYREADNLSSTPVYLAISAKPSTEKNYTDMPLAKQKVFNQWRKSLYMNNHNISKVKTQRPQNHVKAELKSKIQMLKIVLKERIANKEKTIRKKAETQTI